MTTSNDISRAADLIKQGSLVAFPTETVYGLGADATQDLAVAKIYDAKGRPQFNPLISHVASAEAAFALGGFTAMSRKLAQACWPGPLTIVVPRAPHCTVSLLASAGLGSIALRVPQHDVALALLQAADRPVVAPSANLSGRISPTTAQHVRDGLGDKVALVLDGGPCSVGVESTVVSFLDAIPRLLRPGGVKREAIESLLQQHVALAAPSLDLHAPGQLESHYAPRAQLRLNADHPFADELYLGFGQHAHGRHTLSAGGDLVEAAAQLFASLHALDATSPTTIAIAPIPHHGLGMAINDRLRRAAAPRHS
jgi:L-threonylcarbamoyladenylate synthase